MLLHCPTPAASSHESLGHGTCPQWSLGKLQSRFITFVEYANYFVRTPRNAYIHACALYSDEVRFVYRTEAKSQRYVF